MTQKTTQLPDRKLLWIRGKDALTFLQGLITADVPPLKEGKATYSGLLSPQGKLLFDFFLFSHGDGYLLDCPAIQHEDLIKRLTFYKLRAQVTIEPEDTLKVFATVAGEEKKGFADPRDAGMGRRIYASEIDARGSPQIYNKQRIQHGLAEGGSDFQSGALFPHEANFDQIGAVSFTKGCFVGQEVVSRMEHRGTARSRIVPARIEGQLPEKGVSVTVGNTAIGTVLSGQGEHALALLRLDRLREAVENGVPVAAGQSILHPYRPPWAKFDVPGPRQERLPQ